jgi:DMSO/TMAO reductase YedYZ molybdopterin-dependent catalytic subunit
MREQPLSERFPDLQVFSERPENAEPADRRVYRQFVTPVGQHYVRNHYPTPNIDGEAWSVSLTGAVERPTELSMAALRHDFPTGSIVHTMQCSGNGRASFDPDASGHQWTTNAAGTAVWTGTPLDAVLSACGADTADGMWVTAMGGDAPPDEEVFARSIPMGKAAADCLLAYEMNGQRLPPDHGYPVRLVVPGWYGNNSVKWVRRLHVMETMAADDEWAGYTHWQQRQYRLVPDRETTPRHRETLDSFDLRGQARDGVDHPYMYDQIPVSVIGAPDDGAELAPRSDGKVEIRGVAWAGEARVSGVEVSTDGGDTWDAAEFFGPDLGPHAWRHFRYVWDADPGEHRLVSRATDERGHRQPARVAGPDEPFAIDAEGFPWNREGYGNNAYATYGVDVTVVE